MIRLVYNSNKIKYNDNDKLINNIAPKFIHPPPHLILLQIKNLVYVNKIILLLELTISLIIKL